MSKTVTLTHYTYGRKPETPPHWAIDVAAKLTSQYELDSFVAGLTALRTFLPATSENDPWGEG